MGAVSREASRPSIVTIPVSNGLYSVLLGDASLSNMIPIPPAVFTNSDVRLRVWFNDGIHGVQLMAPDQRIAAVGYAMMAAAVPNGVITGASLATGAITSANLAPGAAAANLQAGGQAGVASDGIILSTEPSFSKLAGRRICQYRQD